MIEFLRSLFNKPEEETLQQEIRNSDARFVLYLNDPENGMLEIGTLEYRDGNWIFQYSDEFRNQDKYSRLVGFSDLEKTYKSDVLWPFFKIRIPGLKQPMIQEIIEREQINQNDEASLLKRFGQQTTSNPYLLESA